MKAGAGGLLSSVTTAVWRLSHSSQPRGGSGHNGPRISVVNLWTKASPSGTRSSHPSYFTTVVEAAYLDAKHTALPV